MRATSLTEKVVLVVLLVCNVISEAEETSRVYSNIVEELKAYDRAFLREQTLTVELDWNKSFLASDPAGYTEKATLATKDGSTAWNTYRIYHTKPCYPESKLNRINYDEQGNFICWRVIRTQGLLMDDLQARRTEKVLILVNPHDRTIQEEEAAPDVEFRQRLDSLKIIDYMLPIWSTGRGYASYLVRLKDVTVSNENEVSFTAYGHFGEHIEGTWKITIDLNNGYLVRSARFPADGDSPIVFVSTSGTKWFEDYCVAERAHCCISGPDNVVSGVTQEYRSVADQQLIADLHSTFSDLSPDTDVTDWRWNHEKPLRFRVGKLNISDRELLDDLFVVNPNVVPDIEGYLQADQRTVLRENSEDGSLPVRLRTLPRERNTNRVGDKVIFLGCITVAGGVIVVVWRLTYAKRRR
jgi:hypothetical protein